MSTTENMIFFLSAGDAEVTRGEPSGQVEEERAFLGRGHFL